MNDPIFISHILELLKGNRYQTTGWETYFNLNHVRHIPTTIHNHSIDNHYLNLYHLIVQEFVNIPIIPGTCGFAMQINLKGRWFQHCYLNHIEKADKKFYYGPTDKYGVSCV